MLHAGIVFWKENVKVDHSLAFQNLKDDVDASLQELEAAAISDDTVEVAYVVTGD